MLKEFIYSNFLKDSGAAVAKRQSPVVLFSHRIWTEQEKAEVKALYELSKTESPKKMRKLKVELSKELVRSSAALATALWRLSLKEDDRPNQF